MQKYEVSNWGNEYSDQKYPLHIDRVAFVDFPSVKYPNGAIQISCKTEDGYWASGLLKCYISKKGKYAIWGKHRIYEGYRGGVELIGVPFRVKESLRSLADKYGSVIS
jgi:hypothetical protein